MSQNSLFEVERLQMDQSLAMTIESLTAYGQRHRHWAIAWSGGKDSTTLLTLVIHLLETGQVPKPERLTVCYADTRQELVPLSVAANEIMSRLRGRGYDVRPVMAPMDRRFLVYILGRGVPPPNNNTFRWCTRQIKIDPMQEELRRIAGEAGSKVLMLTGVRQGESAIRDGRIAMSCGRDGAECGQGWYQETMPEQLCNTLAPILHWRVCHVWEWLWLYAPTRAYGSWPTTILAEAYGGDEREEINARTGCMGCPLAHKDTALLAVIKQPAWSYLSPLLELRDIYAALREPRNRLRKRGGETRKDGSLVDNQYRMGPLTMDARRWAMAGILEIQERCNQTAREQGRPEVDILNPEEVGRIEELISLNTWPQKWTGEEPTADQPYEETDDTDQLGLFDALEEAEIEARLDAGEAPGPVSDWTM